MHNYRAGLSALLRGVARNLFRRGTKEWVPSPEEPIYRHGATVGSGAKPLKHEKYAENLIEYHKFHTTQTIFFSMAISEGTCPLAPFPTPLALLGF